MTIIFNKKHNFSFENDFAKPYRDIKYVRKGFRGNDWQTKASWNAQTAQFINIISN